MTRSQEESLHRFLHVCGNGGNPSVPQGGKLLEPYSGPARPDRTAIARRPYDHCRLPHDASGCASRRPTFSVPPPIRGRPRSIIPPPSQSRSKVALVPPKTLATTEN